LFSNRALTRVKLQDWNGAENDARKAIELYGPKNPLSMKPYKVCLEIKDSSSEVLSQFILRTKQAQWQSKETARLRELNETLATVEDLLQQQLDKDLANLEGRYSRQEIGEIGRNEERTALEKEAEERRSNIRDAFKNAQKEETAERVSLIASPTRPYRLTLWQDCTRLSD
jgi:STIP1 homology and U-box containing protein 1